ncbi:MAG: DUF1467 family protein [Alphaproteobacteria bacterium]|nr:DUF1467 family protein [Alphaproteobacteria bacterium]
MSVVSAVLVFVCLWWLVFIPVVTRGLQAAANPGRGHDRGAPVDPQIGRRLLLCTAITGVIYLPVFFVLFHYGVADL